MANVFNRKTKEYLISRHTPDYPISEWIINPSFIPNCEKKYILVEGDTIREMDLDEKAVVDYVAPVPEPTAEELVARAAEERRQNIIREIALTYSLTDEIGIIREVLAEEFPNNVRAQAYNAAIESIIAKHPKE